ncbi:bZIP transcription factor 29 [Linum grandiflorum]
MCGTMRQSSPNIDPQETNSTSNKRIGLPPSHPNNPHFFASGLVSDQPSHLRSSMFSIDFHPMEQNAAAASSQGIVSRVNDGGTGLPPLRAVAHRRAISDTVPLGFCDMIQSSPQLVPIRGFDRLELVKQESGWGIVEGTGEKRGEATDEMMSGYMHMDNVDPLNSSGTEDNKDLDSGTKTNGTESSDNEAESHHVKGLKRSADADIGPAGRHSRSVSMDSFMGGLRLDEESMIMKLPPMGVRVSPSSSSSMQGHLTKFNLEFGNGEFTEGELKKIMSNDKLTELAMADPKRVKRILANRLSAARSKERKMRYIAELELKVQGLQAEATTLSAQVTVLQRDSANLTSQNNELKFRLQSIEQQTQLKDVFFTTWMQT